MSDPHITQGQLKALVSYDAKTGQFHWRVNRRRARKGDVCGWLDTDGYFRTTLCGQKVRLHRVAWFYVHGKWPVETIDHIDRNRANNALANLREATSGENARNKPCLGYTVVKGKYMAQIKLNDRNIYLGLHETPASASAAYAAAALQYHGEFSAIAQKAES